MQARACTDRRLRRRQTTPAPALPPRIYVERSARGQAGVSTMFVAGLAVFLSLAAEPPAEMLANPVNYGCSETLYVHWPDFGRGVCPPYTLVMGADNRFYNYTDALATWIYNYYAPATSCETGFNRQLYDSAGARCCESLPQNSSHMNAICQPVSAEAVCAHATPVYKYCSAAEGCKATWFFESVDCSSNLTNGNEGLAAGVAAGSAAFVVFMAAASA
jgi:hypothetical protein